MFSNRTLCSQADIFFFQFKALNKKMAVQMKHDSDTFSLDFNLKILLVRFILIAAEVMKH